MKIRILSKFPHPIQIPGLTALTLCENWTIQWLQLVMSYLSYLSHPTPSDLQLTELQLLPPQQPIEHKPILPQRMKTSALFSPPPLHGVQPLQALLLDEIMVTIMVHLALGDIAPFKPWEKLAQLETREVKKQLIFGHSLRRVGIDECVNSACKYLNIIIFISWLTYI